MACVEMDSVDVVAGGANGNKVAVARERDGYAAEVAGVFSVDIGTTFNPIAAYADAAIPFIDARVACITKTAAVPICANRHEAAVTGERDGYAALVP